LDPIPDPDPTFKEVSAPTPDMDPVSDPATLVSASRGLRDKLALNREITTIYKVFFGNLFLFIYLCIWLRNCDFIREVLFQIHSGYGLLGSTPDPAKSFGSDSGSGSTVQPKTLFRTMK
jgi:hypothetical protein